MSSLDQLTNPRRRYRRLLQTTAGALVLVASALGQSAPAPAPATQTPASAAPVAPPPAPAITYSGMLDVYYGYNFNKPQIANGVATTGPGQRNFDYKDNLLSLGLAEFGISKATTDTSRFGFTIKFAYGPTADLIASPGDQNNKNILQAYGTYVVPVGKNKTVSIDAGKFVTHMGYEVIEPGLNVNYSRSDLFQYLVPYYHAGVRAAMPITPTVTGVVYLYNGWNDVSYDTNPNKAFGAGLTFTPNADTSFVLQGLTSNEPSAVVDEPKTTLEAIATRNFTSALSGAVDFNYDFGQQSAQPGGPVTTSNWKAYGAAAYLKYAWKSGSYLAIRGEFIKDSEGFLLGTAADTNLSEVTLTYSWQKPIFPNSEIRFEYRHDSTNQNGLFVGNDGMATKHQQDTISISHIMKF